MEFEELAQILAGLMNADINCINEDSRINDVAGWDSLNHVKLLHFLEEVCNISINESNVYKTMSVPGLLELLKPAK